MTKPSSFERVYEEHVWRVYGFLAYRLQSREQAEDLTQETFERALRNWPKFDPGRSSERTWLLAIARNLLVDSHRRDRTHPVAEVDERMLPAYPGPEADLEAMPALVDALAQLGNRERELIALRFGGELTGPEIAEMLGLSLSNVQQILSRSLRRLKQQLEGVPR